VAGFCQKIEDGTHHDAAVRDGEERLLATVE